LLERLLDEVYSDEIVQSRERLEPWIPALREHLPRLWTAVFVRCTTRFNKYLFLNGVDSLQLLFRGSQASPEARDAVARHALAFPDSYLPDEWDDELFEEREVHTRRATRPGSGRIRASANDRVRHGHASWTSRRSSAARSGSAAISLWRRARSAALRMLPT
jgi:hypothetical protein